MATLEEFLKDKKISTGLYNGKNTKANYRIVHNTRILTALLAGVTAGILGLESYWGLAWYLAVSAAGSGLLVAKASVDYRAEYVPAGSPKPESPALVFFKSAKALWWEGISGGLLSFILGWTLLYDVVYIFR